MSNKIELKFVFWTVIFLILISFGSVKSYALELNDSNFEIGGEITGTKGRYEDTIKLELLPDLDKSYDAYGAIKDYNLERVAVWRIDRINLDQNGKTIKELDYLTLYLSHASQKMTITRHQLYIDPPKDYYSYGDSRAQKLADYKLTVSPFNLYYEIKVDSNKQIFDLVIHQSEYYKSIKVIQSVEAVYMKNKINDYRGAYHNNIDNYTMNVDVELINSNKEVLAKRQWILEKGQTYNFSPPELENYKRVVREGDLKGEAKNIGSTKIVVEYQPEDNRKPTNIKAIEGTNWITGIGYPDDYIELVDNKNNPIRGTVDENGLFQIRRKNEFQQGEKLTIKRYINNGKIHASSVEKIVEPKQLNTQKIDVSLEIPKKITFGTVKISNKPLSIYNKEFNGKIVNNMGTKIKLKVREKKPLTLLDGSNVLNFENVSNNDQIMIETSEKGDIDLSKSTKEMLQLKIPIENQKKGMYEGSLLWTLELVP